MELRSKRMPKITRIQLDDKANEEYTILGIVSSEADYKISQLLNKKLKLALKNNKALDVPGVNGMNLSFSRYSCTTGVPEISYNLISNRSDKNYLLKKLKNIDYILQIYCNDNKCDIDLLTKTLREIEKITAVFSLDPREIKDKNLAYLTL
jgi:hypothetical protein